MRVLSVNVGRVEALTVDGQVVDSAIRKRPCDSDVAVSRSGLAGDEQADGAARGNISRAICAYPSEHFEVWRTMRAQARAADWDDPVPPGLLGENLTLAGLTEDRLWVGDQLLLPHCVLAVSAPRLPCPKLNAALGFRHAAKLMVESAYSGWYLGVIEPGHVRAGDPIELLPGPRAVNLRDLFRERTQG